MSLRVSSFIHEYRVKNDLTQKQFAELVGVTDKCVSKWERGEGYPDVLMLPTLAEIFGVRIDDLFVRTAKSELQP